jgi:GntR family transcriptional regulator / MocR family aminotransferase
VKKTTSAVELLLRLERRAAVPLRLQLERELRRAVQSGRLLSGSAMPSTRALAADLGVSRGVVVEAYEQLLAEGYLSATHGSATRVAARRAHTDSVVAPEPATPVPRFDLRPGLPDLSLFPRRAWLLSMRRALASAPNGAFDYPDARGVEQARIALATYVNRARATVARPERVMFTSGSAQGIGLVCRVLRDRGVRSVAVENPGQADQCTDI